MRFIAFGNKATPAYSKISDSDLMTLSVADIRARQRGITSYFGTYWSWQGVKAESGLCCKAVIEIQNISQQ